MWQAGVYPTKRIERAAPRLVLRLTVAGGGDLNRCAVYLPTARPRSRPAGRAGRRVAYALSASPAISRERDQLSRRAFTGVGMPARRGWQAPNWQVCDSARDSS